MAVEFAPAKLNLTLHVTGRREDGYHKLDSLVVFVGVCDELRLTPIDAAGVLELSGRFGAGLPSGGDNLVLRAARLWPQGQDRGFHLVKNLPPASGIGGGSADAAAAIRLVLGPNWQDIPDVYEKALALGADVPVCLASKPVRMMGIGEQLAPVPPIPAAWMVLGNPLVEVPTPAVFRALQCRDNPAMPDQLPHWRNLDDFARWLGTQRNDLAVAAESLAPEIGIVRKALSSQDGCLIARMSGSGATCFGLFATQKAAQSAALRLQAQSPQWWWAAAPILSA